MYLRTSLETVHLSSLDSLLYSFVYLIVLLLLNFKCGLIFSIMLMKLYIGVSKDSSGNKHRNRFGRDGGIYLTGG